MIKSNTVLVLGAGASAPFGFPTGKRLMDLICDKILQQKALAQFLEKMGFAEKEIALFARALTHSGRPSVDAFLEYRDDFLEIGKTAIAAVLLPCEITSGLFRDWIVKRMGPEPIQADNWYDLLFGVLADGVPFEEFDKHKLSIITFNYDRSIEHYLFTSLKHSYNKTDEECGEKLRKINIIHVHGSLGPLDWQSHPAGLPSVPYDSGLNPEIIMLAAQNIKIIHEDITDTPEFVQAWNKLLRSTQALFLGFGFHPTNMKRLMMSNLHSKNIDVMGTSQGLSHQRKEEIKHFHSTLTEGHHNLVSKDVYTFLHEHVSFG